MSSGRLRLSVRGQEDLIISGTPQYSYYLKNFSRYEPYEYLFVDNALDTIIQGRTPTYGDTISFQVPVRGDVLSRIFLKIVLPPSYLYSNLIRTKTDTFNLYSIIEHVDLIIGGQLIQRLTGEYILNYINLYYSSNELDFFHNATEMKIKDLKKTYSQFGQFVLLPIPFYFSNKKGSEIPLLALSRQHVKVNIKLAPKPPITDLPDLTDVTVSTEYILLGSEMTKNIFRNNGLKYRITQVQMNSAVVKRAETKKVMDLNFQNPIREMFMCIQPQTYQDINNSKYYNYFANYRNSFVNYRDVNNGWYLSEHHITGMSLTFNNNEYIRETGSGSAQMMCSAIPQKYYANSDNIQQFRGYVYPFVIDPLSNDPKGHINMSRILKKQMTFFMNESQLTRDIRVYASSYNILAIRDGVSGLMFTNPSHYNPKIVLGETSEVTEGTLPTDLEVLTPDQGYYYAIKVSEGNSIVGVQLHTATNPEFGGDQDLHDDQFSYLLNTNDTFMSNVIATDRAEYAPGSISALLQNVIEIPNEQNEVTADLYAVTSSNNYIFTSNFGFIKNLRLAIKVHELTGSLGPDALDTYPSAGYSNLSLTATVNVYSSNTFFDPTDIPGWIAGAEVDSRIIRGNDNIYESPGYYYAGRSLVDDNQNITGYSKVHFARTYDFTFESSIADVSEIFDGDFDSDVSLKITNLSGSGFVDVFLGSSTRGTRVFYNEGDTDVDITFKEELERGLKTYSVVISPDGTPTTTRVFQIVAGGNAPPLYHAFAFNPPDGSVSSVSMVGIQSYSPAANVANLVTNGKMVTLNVTPLSNLNAAHSGYNVPLSNIYFEDIIPVTIRYLYDGTVYDIYPPGATPIAALQMGGDNYFYTTTNVSITYYVAAIETTTPPDLNSVITMYSSDVEFGTPTVSDWISDAENRSFRLSELTNSGPERYKSSFQQRREGDADFGGSQGRNYMTRYFIPFDTIAPIMTITYKGNLITDGDTITVERLTPLSELIKLPPSVDYTYINIQVDDTGASITDSNNIVVNTIGTYAITFTATDPFLNFTAQSFVVEVEDTQPPELVSNVITGNGLGLTLAVEINETANVDLKQNGSIIQSYIGITQFTKVITGLTEDVGVLQTYTADTEDDYGNTGTLALGTYVPDITAPELFINNYSDVRIFTGTTLYLERYSSFVDIEVTAIDTIDGPITVVQGGGTPDTTQRAGDQTVRTYTATDVANNSNVASITFEISDTVQPGLTVLNPLYLIESTREVTISGTATEECSILLYRDSARTQLVSNTETVSGNTFSNTFVETVDGMHKYYLSLYDGVNHTNTLSTSDIYISDYIYRFPYEGFSNTSVTVPAGTTNLFAFVWGANGGSWIVENDRNIKVGGGGGFTESKISPVTPGTQITVNVGQGALVPDGEQVAFGGGGTANNYRLSIPGGGSGGGASNVIYNNTVTIAVAGGGGGAAPNRFSSGGDGGGGLVGESESANTGGTQTAGGVADARDPSADYIGNDGSFLTGGNANAYTVNAYTGGGGGGGWYGGAAGTSDTSSGSTGPGGGGSSWLGRNGASILTHSSNQWGTTTIFEDTGGRTDAVTGLTYTNSKMLRGPHGTTTKPLLGEHFFWTGDYKNGYVVIMFT